MARVVGVSLHMPRVEGGGICLNQVCLVLAGGPPCLCPQGQPQLLTGFGSQGNRVPFYLVSQPRDDGWKWGHRIPSGPGLLSAPCGGVPRGHRLLPQTVKGRHSARGRGLLPAHAPPLALALAARGCDQW